MPIRARIAMFGLVLGLLAGPALGAVGDRPSKAPPQIALSPALVQHFIASYKPVEAFGRKYDAKWGDEDFTDPKSDGATQMRQTLEAHGALDEFKALIGRYGFSGVEEWYTVAYSTMIAYGFADPETDLSRTHSKAAASLAKIKADPKLTQDQKDEYERSIRQALDSLDAMRPPAQNIEVVRPYRTKLKELLGDAAPPR